MCHVISSVWLFVTPWTIAHQASLSMESSWQEYWIGWSFPNLGNFSPLRDWTRISCLGRRILYHCTKPQVNCKLLADRFNLQLVFLRNYKNNKAFFQGPKDKTSLSSEAQSCSGGDGAGDNSAHKLVYMTGRVKSYFGAPHTEDWFGKWIIFGGDPTVLTKGRLSTRRHL